MKFTISLFATGLLIMASSMTSADEAQDFLEKYNNDYSRLSKAQRLIEWRASNTGSPEDFAAAAAADLKLNQLHSDRKAFEKVKSLQQVAGRLDPITARSLEVAHLAFARQQLPEEDIKKMIDLSSEVNLTFNTWRSTLDGERKTNNQLLSILSKEKDSRKRQQAWEALKQVGGKVAPDVIRLAKTRNAAAKKLGYDNYWRMRIHFQEHDPKELTAIFDNLEKMTRGPFTDVKREIDAELARRFGVKPEELMPWHYDNPFFQAAPPSEKVDFNEFFKDKTKEEIVEISRRFFRDIDLPVEDILEKSSLYEREGKDQHAFCTNIDRKGDVRILCNVRPTAEWTQTTLHELGHAVYSKYVDPELPFNIRGSAHALTSEGIAMMFGALPLDPRWLVAYAGADPKRVAEVEEAIRQQWRRDQLIFVQWTLVMFHFEKALYENPDQDLDSLWWDYVERFQQLRRPPGRQHPDWAAKPHFTIAPVYYHNYMLGELYAAQQRNALARLDKDDAPPGSLVDFNGRKDYGRHLIRKTFHPGRRWCWPDFVEHATGHRLNPKYFAAEVGAKPGT